MATLAQLEEGLQRAYNAGNMEYARILAAEVSRARKDKANLIPDVQVPGTTPQAPEPSMLDTAVGTGEAALTTLTGATGGTIGMIGGTLKGLAEQILNGQFGTQEALKIVEQSAVKGAQALTYAPRTESGQKQAQAVGDVAQNLIPVAPLTAEMGAIATGARAAAPVVAAASRRAAAPVIQAAERVAEPVQRAAQSVGEAMGMEPKRQPMAGVGSAVTDISEGRVNVAEGLPVPIKLTKGAATRDAEQLAFEKEQIKSPTMGAPLRARQEENNLQTLQNFDSFIDMSGAAAPDIAATGNAVVKALSEGHKAAKNKTNVAYRAARNSEEANAPVDPGAVVRIGEGENAINNSLVGYLNEKISGTPSAAVPDTARKLMVKMGLAVEDANGTLVARPATVGKMEDFRRELSGTAKWDDAVGVREETILKKLIDAQTEPVSGQLYAQARALRAEQARKYENRAIVARLITNRKGMDDPQVAIDQVFNRSIIGGSPEEITFLKRVLVTSGKDGKQAWKELQGATAKYIRDEATKGMGMDSNDNPIVSPAKLNQIVGQLDKNGRLDIVFGKQNAQVMRDLNDVVRYVNTVPPGTLVNTSGTAGALMAAIAEAGATGALTGLPMPIISLIRAASKRLRDNKVKARIQRALDAVPEKRKPEGIDNGRNNSAAPTVPGHERIAA